MQTPHHQRCPLCTNDSTFSKTSNPVGKIFSCNNCKIFWIDSYSESCLESIPGDAGEEMRNKLSGHAQKSAENRLYVIREPKPSEIIGDGSKVALESFRTEWVNLSDRS